MTREEIKEWGHHMAEKVFHKRHHEVKIKGIIVCEDDKNTTIEIVDNTYPLSSNKPISFPICLELLRHFNCGDSVEITIKK